MTKKWPQQNPDFVHPLVAERDRLKAAKNQLAGSLTGLLCAVKAQRKPLTTADLNKASAAVEYEMGLARVVLAKFPWIPKAKDSGT